MAEWKTRTATGLIVGIVLMVLIAGVGGSLIWLAVTRPLDIGTFLMGLSLLPSLGLLGLMGYWVYGLVRSSYLLDRNALIIQWGPNVQTIPLQLIQRVLSGEDIVGRVRLIGGVWPGHFVGYGEVPGSGTTLFFATVRPRRQIYVVTPGLTYGISPADRNAFIESLQKRMEMGPTQSVEQSSQRPGILDWEIWRDRVGLGLIAGGVVLLLGLVGILCFRYPNLPLIVPLHFDALGMPDRMGDRASLFVIPIIGLLVLSLNGVLGWVVRRFDRIASYLLWGGAVLIQVFVWVAAVGILRQL